MLEGKFYFHGHEYWDRGAVRADGGIKEPSADCLYCAFCEVGARTLKDKDVCGSAVGLNDNLEQHHSFFAFPTGCCRESRIRARLTAGVSYAIDPRPEGPAARLPSRDGC